MRVRQSRLRAAGRSALRAARRCGPRSVASLGVVDFSRSESFERDERKCAARFGEQDVRSAEKGSATAILLDENVTPFDDLKAD